MASFGQNKEKIDKRFRESVSNERDRRLAEGTDINLPGYGWVAFEGRLQDRAALSELAQAASLMKSAGYDGLIPFTDRNDYLHLLKPEQVEILFVLGSAFVSNIFQDSVFLKAYPDKPKDCDSDKYWTTKTVKE